MTHFYAIANLILHASSRVSKCIKTLLHTNEVTYYFSIHPEFLKMKKSYSRKSSVQHLQRLLSIDQEVITQK